MSVHFRSGRQDWRTPENVFEDLHAEFEFTIDACATDENAALSRYWTEQDEPLLKSWAGERVYMNPPYGRQIARWMEKAWTEAPDAGVIVALIPARTDSRWWHKYVMDADEIRFLRRRLAFGGHLRENGSENLAPFPSCLAIWRPEWQFRDRA